MSHLIPLKLDMSSLINSHGDRGPLEKVIMITLGFIVKYSYPLGLMCSVKVVFAANKHLIGR